MARCGGPEVTAGKTDVIPLVFLAVVFAASWS